MVRFGVSLPETGGSVLTTTLLHITAEWSGLNFRIEFELQCVNYLESLHHFLCVFIILVPSSDPQTELHVTVQYVCTWAYNKYNEGNTPRVAATQRVTANGFGTQSVPSIIILHPMWKPWLGCHIKVLKLVSNIIVGTSLAIWLWLACWLLSKV